MTTPEFNPAQLDLTDTATVLRELLDNDQRVRAEFVCVLASELAQLTEGLVACFQHMPPIHQAAVRLRSQRVDLMCAFALGVVDDLIVSTKLLLVGKVPASGNVMRQAIEGIAMAMLCSTDDLLVIERKGRRPPVQTRYWKKVLDGDRRVEGQHALRSWVGTRPAWCHSGGAQDVARRAAGFPWLQPLRPRRDHPSRGLGEAGGLEPGRRLRCRRDRGLPRTDAAPHQAVRGVARVPRLPAEHVVTGRRSVRRAESAVDGSTSAFEQLRCPSEHASARSADPYCFARSTLWIHASLR
ncbi:hypothetical protein ACEPT7_28315 [Burkholderia ubonensis]|uniref:hypothetical protein n=1 Tax=Burkholderia ubonensis TaxID=101571 RepID=UPI00358E7A09